MHSTLPPAWRDWITDNISRGCDPRSLIADMVKASFDPEFAAATVFAFSQGHPPPAVLKPADYDYETPRITPGNIIHTPDRDVRVSLRLERPQVVFFDNVLSLDECDELVARSRDSLTRSTTVDPANGKDAVIEARSSEGTFFALNADEFISRLDRRIAAVMNMPVENGEGLQILHYHTGGQYTPHYDYFAPSEPGSAPHIANGGQRVATLIMYLNDVADGGTTIFPEMRLQVGPKKGGAVYFEYCNSRGQLDRLTLHGGTPVLAGEKWIATKWMRQNRYCQAVSNANM
jgi:prolyl 4-hydroxylase